MPEKSNGPINPVKYRRNVTIFNSYAKVHTIIISHLGRIELIYKVGGARRLPNDKLPFVNSKWRFALLIYLAVNYRQTT